MGDLTSVVIPVYNSARFLGECIRSVLDQTWADTEVIAVNDGSTDGSGRILEGFSGDITVIDQDNGGLPSALLAGIRRMRGRWFKWFSPDDIMYPGAVETQVRMAGELPPDTILYSDWDVIDVHGRKMRSFRETDCNGMSAFDFNVRLLDGQQVNVNTALIPAGILREKATFRNLPDPVTVDYDFFLRAALLHSARFHLVPEPLVGYRAHPGQLSHKNISGTLDNVGKIRDGVLGELQDSQRERYLGALQDYRAARPASAKLRELGLRVVRRLPPGASDRMITFYLNGLRRTRG